MPFVSRSLHAPLKWEVRRKMNFIYVLGFVVLIDVVKVFPVSSPSFARKMTGRNRARSHSGAWRGLRTKWDLKLSLPSPIYLIRCFFNEVGTTTPKLKLDAFPLWQLRNLNFQSFSDPSGIRWRGPGAVCMVDGWAMHRHRSNQHLPGDKSRPEQAILQNRQRNQSLVHLCTFF